MKNKTSILIQMHNNDSYIKELVKKNKDVNFYVHTDNKRDIFDASFLKNVFVVKNRECVYWGGVSQILATLVLLKEAVETSSSDYFHLISGECIPLIDFMEMERIWKAKGDVAYIEARCDIKYSWRMTTLQLLSDSPCMRSFLGRVTGKLFRLFRRDSIYNDKNTMYGSQWFSLKRCHIEKILKFTYDNPRWIMDLKYTACSDEHFIQTIINVIDPKSIMNNNKRFIKWENGASSPKYLSMEELYNAKSSGIYWFARKVSSETAISFINESCI